MTPVFVVVLAIAGYAVVAGAAYEYCDARRHIFNDREWPPPNVCAAAWPFLIVGLVVVAGAHGGRLPLLIGRWIGQRVFRKSTIPEAKARRRAP